MRVVHISINDPFLDSAIARDKRYEEKVENVNPDDPHHRFMTGNARRYLESKLTGIHVKDLEVLEQAEYLMPDEDMLFDLGRIAFG